MTDQVVRVEPGGYRPGSAHGAALGGGEPVALAGVRPLGLVVRLPYALVPAGGPEAGWEVAARAYEYPADLRPPAARRPPGPGLPGRHRRRLGW